MEGPAKCFVSGVLAALLRISRLAGVAPLRFQKQGNGWQVCLSPKLHIIGCIVSIAICIATSFNKYYSVLLAINYDSLQLITRTVTSTLEEVAVMATALALVFGAPSRMRCLLSSISQVQTIYFKLYTFCLTKWMTKPFGFILIFWQMTIIITSVLGYVILVLHTNLHSLTSANTWYFLASIQVTYLVYRICGCIVELGMIQFMMTVMLVRSSFKSINDSLRTLQQESVTNSRSYCEAVKRSTLAYASACNLVRDVTSCHGLTVMMFIAVIFLQLIITPYHVIFNLYERGLFDLTGVVFADIIQVYWCICHIFNLVMLVEPCHLTHMEMECTREIVSKLLLTRRTRATNDPTVTNLEQFCRNITLNDVSYKPLQVTKMSRGMVLSVLFPDGRSAKKLIKQVLPWNMKRSSSESRSKILGSITTYLVILTGIK